jgi:hypothetical protein
MVCPAAFATAPRIAGADDVAGEVAELGRLVGGRVPLTTQDQRGEGCVSGANRGQRAYRRRQRQSK